MTGRTSDQHKAIAYLVNAINPKWDRSGVESLLSRIDPAISLAAVTHAAVVAAATRRDQKTPAVIGMTGQHWNECTGEKPSLRLPAWRDPDADVTPADPATIRAIRARKDRP